jgi:hypothetical protein
MPAIPIDHLTNGCAPVPDCFEVEGYDVEEGARSFGAGAEHSQDSPMPIHDWMRADAGIFHHFHQRWIGAITDVLNQRLLPGEYYALAEQQGSGFELDVLTLKMSDASEAGDDLVERGVAQSSGKLAGNGSAGSSLLVAEPSVSLTAETDLDFYRRKQNVAAIRHVSDDRLVAIALIVNSS